MSLKELQNKFDAMKEDHKAGKAVTIDETFSLCESSINEIKSKLGDIKNKKDNLDRKKEEIEEEIKRLLSKAQELGIKSDFQAGLSEVSSKIDNVQSQINDALSQIEKIKEDSVLENISSELTTSSEDLQKISYEAIEETLKSFDSRLGFIKKHEPSWKGITQDKFLLGLKKYLLYEGFESPVDIDKLATYSEMKKKEVENELHRAAEQSKKTGLSIEFKFAQSSSQEDDKSTV